MSDYTLGYWRPLFRTGSGWVEDVQHATGKAMPTSFGIAAEQNVNVVRIDLQGTSGLEFYSTPGANQAITRPRQTVLDFLSDSETPLNTVLAINGALATYIDAFNGGGAEAVVFGALISQGKVVCDPTQPIPIPGWNQPDVRDARDAGAVALTITKGDSTTASYPVASFQIINAETKLPSNWGEIYTAVGGSPNVGPEKPPTHFNKHLLVHGEAMVLRNGWNRGIPFRPQDLDSYGNDAVWIAGRTAVGLSKDTRYLFFLTIDGVEDQSQRYGATFYDVGQWLLIAGASDGLTLDGGGSTAMAMKALQTDSSFLPVLMNTPRGDEQSPYQARECAHFLGVVVPGVVSEC